jgi:propionate CoA-transferase
LKSKVMSAAEAVELIQDGDTVALDCSGGGVNEPVVVLAALEKRFLDSGHPRDLTLYQTNGVGDGQGGGTDRFAHHGMTRRVLVSHWGWTPRLSQMAIDNDIEAYAWPQGVMSHLLRAVAGNKPGVFTKVGLHTYVDPRIEGGRCNQATEQDLVELVELRGEEWLFYPSIPMNAAIIRGSYADLRGNISMEREGVFLEALSTAQAVHNSGGVVIAQVKWMCESGTLDPRLVKVPGILVDAVVVDPDQRQSLATDYNPAFVGEVRAPMDGVDGLPLDAKKVMARRAATELVPGVIANLGFGVADGVPNIAAEEGMIEAVTFTIEQGAVGGMPALGSDFGVAWNPDVILDQGYQFDFYDGGGLDVAFLSFAQVNPQGSVNVTKFASRQVGPGGFINISQNARKVVFMGTLTTKGLEETVGDGRLHLHQDGKIKKFVEKLDQVSFSGPFALEKDQTILYVTERAVFKLTEDGVTLVELAPGVELEKDVLDKMGFRPIISPDLKPMDPRLFRAEKMGLSTRTWEAGA